MLLQMFRTLLLDNTELSDKKINELVDTFMNTLPNMLKTQLKEKPQKHTVSGVLYIFLYSE